jgi:hypothetical protein
MALRISELVLDCHDPVRLARFWCEALDFVVVGREPDGSLEIGPTTGFGGPQPTMILSPSTRQPRERGMLHFDVSPVESTLEAEVERLRGLGAEPADVGQTGEEDWVVLQDPEGNVFCVLQRSLDMLPRAR